jgi:hypothetical protein
MGIKGKEVIVAERRAEAIVAARPLNAAPAGN